MPRLILGAGSNVLVSDRLFNGLVIHPSGGAIEITGNQIRADASVSMARVVAESLRAGLRGFEWAIGVPGTIGGSVRGNAGCFGSEMKEVITALGVFNFSSGEIEEWSGEAAEFGYRESVFKRRPELVIISAVLRLQPGDAAAGEGLVRQYTLHRAKTQDIGSFSAGCIFKNIPWERRDVDAQKLVSRFPELVPFRSGPAIPAGFLIDQAGLKGRKVGRAKISERHGNFFINTGGAKAEEVLILISIAKEHVRRRYGLLLEEEIHCIGF